MIVLVLAALSIAKAQGPAAEVFVRADKNLAVTQLAKEVGSFAKIDSRTPGTSIYLLQMKSGIDDDEARRRLAKLPDLEVLDPDEEPVDFRSMASLNRKLSHLEKDEDKDKGSQKGEGVDYLRAYQYFVSLRAYPHDSVDWSAYGRAAVQSAQMRPAVLSNGANRPLTSGTGWQFVGPTNLTVPYAQYYGLSPVNGRFNAVAFDPNNSQTLYAGAAQGGMWKSTDAGTTWNWLSARWAHLAVNCIAIDPLDSNTIYVGLGDYHGLLGGSYGLMKSTDGGTTWAEIGTAFMGQIGIARIMIDPTANQTLIAGTGDIGSGSTPGYGKLYRSTNGGQTWTVVNTLANSFWPAIAASTPNNGAVRFYAVAAGFGGSSTSSVSRVYKSDDHGATWQNLASPVNTSDKLAHWAYCVATSPTNPNGVYALDSEHDKLYASTNQGSSWTDITKNFPTGNTISTNYNWSQNFYDYHLECGSRTFNGATKDVIFVGEIDLAESADNGSTWQSIGGPTYGSAGAVSHNDQHCLAVCPTNPNLALFSNDGGVYEVRYNPGSTPPNTVSNLNKNLGASMFYKIAVHPYDPAILLGGTQDNASPLSRDDLSNWRNSGGGDGGGSVINQINPLIQYTTSENLVFFRTGDGWQNIINNFSPNLGSDPPPFVASLVADPSNPTLIYSGTDYLYLYNENTHAWTARLGSQRLTGAVTSANPSPQVLGIAIAPTDSKRIYTGSSDGQLWMSTTQGSTWKQLNAGATLLPGEAITSISVNPANSSDILIGFSGTDSSGHLWRCANTQASPLAFTNVSSGGANGLPTISLNAIVRDLVDPVGTWWVATDIGVFRTADSGATWQNAGSALGLPNVIVDDLAISPGTGYLTAGTYGRGMWRLPIPVPPLGVTNFSLTANSVRKGQQLTGTITLSRLAPEGGQVVQISTDNAAATFPTSVTVPAGTISTQFTISTLPSLTATATAVITVSADGISASQTLVVTVPTLSGKILFNDYVGTPPSTVTLSFRIVNHLFAFSSMTVNVAPDGSFVAVNVPAQQYDVIIQTGTWLRRTVLFDLSLVDVTNATFSLVNGDINGDNRVDLQDLRLLTAANGSKPGDPNWNPQADLNGDGVVDVKDFQILYRSMLRKGDP